MHITRSTLIRYGSYPLIFGFSTAALLQVAAGHLPYWPYAPLIATLGISSVAVLERIQPFETEWLTDHQDTLVDILHAAFSLSMIFITVELVKTLRHFIDIPAIWPTHWAIWLQLLIAGTIMDFGLWFMHWYSHKNRFLWKLHALHHSSKRLYWLNGERRHPLSALILATPGLITVLLLGAPSPVIGVWMAMTAIHLAFQHANLDYSLGYFKHLLSVAETHRWHHQQGLGQKNLGEFWMIWDHLFGTYHAQEQSLQTEHIGLRAAMPLTYIKQLLWPFKAIYPSRD